MKIIIIINKWVVSIMLFSLFEGSVSDVKLYNHEVKRFEITSI